MFSPGTLLREGVNAHARIVLSGNDARDVGANSAQSGTLRASLSQTIEGVRTLRIVAVTLPYSRPLPNVLLQVWVNKEPFGSYAFPSSRGGVAGDQGDTIDAPVISGIVPMHDSRQYGDAFGDVALSEAASFAAAVALNAHPRVVHHVFDVADQPVIKLPRSTALRSLEVRFLAPSPAVADFSPGQVLALEPYNTSHQLVAVRCDPLVFAKFVHHKLVQIRPVLTSIVMPEKPAVVTATDATGASRSYPGRPARMFRGYLDQNWAASPGDGPRFSDTGILLETPTTIERISDNNPPAADFEGATQVAGAHYGVGIFDAIGERWSRALATNAFLGAGPPRTEYGDFAISNAGLLPVPVQYYLDLAAGVWYERKAGTLALVADRHMINIDGSHATVGEFYRDWWVDVGVPPSLRKRAGGRLVQRHNPFPDEVAVSQRWYDLKFGMWKDKLPDGGWTRSDNQSDDYVHVIDRDFSVISHSSSTWSPIVSVSASPYAFIFSGFNPSSLLAVGVLSQADLDALAASPATLVYVAYTGQWFTRAANATGLMSPMDTSPVPAYYATTARGSEGKARVQGEDQFTRRSGENAYDAPEPVSVIGVFRVEQDTVTPANSIVYATMSTPNGVRVSSAPGTHIVALKDKREDNIVPSTWIGTVSESASSLVGVPSSAVLEVGR